MFMRNPKVVTAYEQAEKARLDRIAEQRYWQVTLEQAAEKGSFHRTKSYNYKYPLRTDSQNWSDLSSTKYLTLIKICEQLH